MPCMKITFSQPEGCTKKGRPRLRWVDLVLTLEVNAWCQKVRDTDQEGQGTKGAVAPKKKKKKKRRGGEEEEEKKKKRRRRRRRRKRSESWNM